MQEPAKSFAEIPGPRGHFLLGSLRERQKDPLRLFDKTTHEFGPVTRYRFGPFRAFLISDPDGVRYMLHENAKNYVKGFGYDKLQLLLGNGLLTSEGEFWRRQRKLAQPAFHRQRIIEFSKTMASVADSTVQAWRPRVERGETFEILMEMMHIAYRIVSSTLFTAQVEGDVSTVRRCLDLLSREADYRITHPFALPPSWPTSRQRRVRAAIREMNEVVYKIISQRRANPASVVAQKDLLSMLMAAQDEETGQGMTDQQLRDEVMTLFTAGHETTAMALTWTLYLLSQNPDIQEHLATELARSGDQSAPPYLLWTIHESLRLFPPGWIIGRQNVEEDVICGYRLPKKSIIFVSPWVLHRSARLWKDPLRFDPTRFSPEEEARRHKFSFLPFGAGPRTCIGNGFALMELQLVLGTLLRNFRFRLVPGHPVVPEPLVTLRPKFGMKMILDQRSN